MIFANPPHTFYYAPYKFLKVGEHAHEHDGRVYLIFKHCKSDLLILARACPEIVVNLSAVSASSYTITIHFTYALSGATFVDVQLDKTQDWPLVLVDREVRRVKHIGKHQKLTYMYEGHILRRNTKMWNRSWPTALEPLRRLRQRTRVTEHLDLRAFFNP